MAGYVTAYQRGARDALLNAAAEFTRKAEGYDADADRMRSGPGFRPDNAFHVRIVAEARRDAEWCRMAAARLMRLSEAMPEDPAE